MDLRRSKRVKNLKLVIPTSLSPNNTEVITAGLGSEETDTNIYDNESSPIFISEDVNLAYNKVKTTMNPAEGMNTSGKIPRTPPGVNPPPLARADPQGDKHVDPDATPPFKGNGPSAPQRATATAVQTVVNPPPMLGYDGTGAGGSNTVTTIEGVTEMEVDEDRQAREKIYQEEQIRKLQALKEEQQHYLMPGEQHVRTNGSVVTANGDDQGNNKVIAGHMLNYLDIQQKKNYDVFWNVNRIEMMHNTKVLRVTGHGLENPNDKDACFNWWLMVLEELDAPPKYLELPQGVIHFSMDSGDSRQGADRGARAPFRQNSTIFIEFPTSELPKWVLNSGIQLCHRLQRKRGMEKLSFNPKLTAFEMKVQQYSLQVVQRIRDNLNGSRADRIESLMNVLRVRGIGRLKEHVALMKNDGKEDKVFYNKLISDDRTRPFLPTRGGETVMPPTDFSISPQDTTLMEIDYKAEAASLGLQIVGKKKGVAMKVPEFVMPSLKKKLNADPNASQGRENNSGWFKLSNSNGTGLGSRQSTIQNVGYGGKGVTPRDEYKQRQNGHTSGQQSNHYTQPSTQVSWNDVRKKTDTRRTGYKDLNPHREYRDKTEWNYNSTGGGKQKEGEYAWSTAKETKSNSSRDKYKESKNNSKGRKYPSSWMKTTRSSRRGDSDSNNKGSSGDESTESGYHERNAAKRRNHRRSPVKSRNSPRRTHKDTGRVKHHSRSEGRRNVRHRSRNREHSRGRGRGNRKDAESKSSDSSSSEYSD